MMRSSASLRTPRFIYFDLGNVLLFFSHRRAARQMAQVAGIDEDLAYECVFGGGELEYRYEAGEFSSAEFCQRFGAATSSCPDPEQLLLASA
ncbi:MAG: hypothetical protein AB7O38_08335, partial [Pirellulaceae bacterium]